MRPNRLLQLLKIVVVTLALTSTACGDVDRYPDRGFASRVRVEQVYRDPTQIAFVEAVTDGRFERATELLGQGASANAVGEQGIDPLTWCVLKQRLECVQFLLRHRADPNATHAWRSTEVGDLVDSALGTAARAADPRYLETLLKGGANPDLIVNKMDETPIFEALRSHQTANIELLLAHGADINHVSSSSGPPIQWATRTNSYADALLLLRWGADPALRDKDGFSAVDTVRQFGNRGVIRDSEHDRAFFEFVDELRRRGHIKPDEKPCTEGEVVWFVRDCSEEDYRPEDYH